MATHANTTRVVAQSTKSKQDAVIAGLMAEANGNAATIRRLSGLLSEIMEEIHGRPYRAEVSHDPKAPFIFIRPND